MNTLEIKNNIHHLIDNIDNENLLLNFYHILKNRTTTKDGDLWARLTKEEKEDLISAFEESKEDYNLIPNEEMKKKHKKWL